MIISYANPSFVIAGDRCAPADDPTWSALLTDSPIQRALPRVGILRSADFGPQHNLGTAWLVRSDLAATNAHITRRLAPGLACGAVAVVLDLRCDPARDPERVRRVLAVDYQADDHDLAFVRLAPVDPPAPALPLAPGAPGDRVAAIGYPSASLAHYDPVAVERMFRGRFDIKRLAPGTIAAVHPQRVDHDCTTLAGNSGSPLVDLARGAVVGVHYGGAGRFLMNWAVPAEVVAARLAAVRA